MLTEPTPFDLRMHLFRIPIRVHPFFWIMAAMLGWSEEIQFTLIWVVCVFVSVLIHELGHALAAESLGWRSEILLYAFGGLAFSERWNNRTPLRDIFVSIAGPAAQFCLLPLIYGVMLAVPHTEILQHEYVFAAIGDLWFINLAWPILNLMPILPLDGGQILNSTLELCGLRDPLTPALITSIIVGGFLAWLSYTMTGQAIFFIILTIMNVQSLQAHRSRW